MPRWPIPLAFSTGPRAISGFYESGVFAGKAVTEIERQFSDGDAEIVQIERRSVRQVSPGNTYTPLTCSGCGMGLIEGLDIYYR